jgi:hypothetical protein
LGICRPELVRVQDFALGRHLAHPRPQSPFTSPVLDEQSRQRHEQEKEEQSGKSPLARNRRALCFQNEVSHCAWFIVSK